MAIPATVQDMARELLERARNGDGGFGPRPDAPSEPEPTALAAIALDVPEARGWLEAHQRDDGSFGIVDGFVRDEATTGLAALGLGDDESRERALDRLEALHGRRIEPNAAVPLNGDLTGWAWTDGAFGWVEPTSRAILALKILRPSSPRIAEGVALLRDRRSVGGGWNYGNRVVLGEELPPFAHTTAIALLALRGLDPELEAEGIARLRVLWRHERTGAISVALSHAAFLLAGDASEADASATALGEVASAGMLDDTVTAGWIVIVAGGGLERFDVEGAA
jgi:hypothetical protein